MYVTYCHASIKKMEIYTLNAFKYSFLLSCIDIMLNYGLKSQQIVLHANLQSEIVEYDNSPKYSPFLGELSYSTAYNS